MSKISLHDSYDQFAIQLAHFTNAAKQKLSNNLDEQTRTSNIGTAEGPLNASLATLEESMKAAQIREVNLTRSKELFKKQRDAAKVGIKDALTKLNAVRTEYPLSDDTVLPAKIQTLIGDQITKIKGSIQSVITNLQKLAA